MATTTTKDTACLTLNEETPQDFSDETNQENEDAKLPPNQYFAKLIRIVFDSKSSNKRNDFNLSLSNTEISPDDRRLEDKDSNTAPLYCCHIPYRNNEKRKIIIISAAVIILLLTVIAIIILASKSFDTVNNANLSRCITTGGPNANKTCIFPFTYKGKVYNNCTLDGDSSGGSWCSTLVDKSGNHVGGSNWGTCGTNCLISRKKVDEDISKCETVDGPDVKKQCVFPFKFKGMTYNSCTWEGDSTGGAWCSTVLGDSGQRIDGVNWGNCGRDCSIPSKPKDTGPKMCNGPGYTKATRDDGSSICYFFYKDNPPRFSYNYNDAKKFCKKKGMAMVDIKGPKDDENVYSVIESGYEKYVLLGAKKIPPPQTKNSTNCTTCLPNYGQFFWPDGSFVSYFDWLPGEPNLPNIQHCIQMYYNEDGKWRDATCHERRSGMMCQLPLGVNQISQDTYIAVRRQNGWCLNLEGNEVDDDEQIDLSNASSPAECFGLCKKQNGAKGCEYSKNGKCSYHTKVVSSGNGHQDYVCWILTMGNPKCDPKTMKRYDSECCSIDHPCGLGQGDCDKDSECSGGLVCGKDNCGVGFNSTTADCCVFKGSSKKFGKWRSLGQCAFPHEFSPENKTVGYNKTCIPGRVQHQVRTCQDGTGGGDSDDQTEKRNGEHKCRLEEKIRSIECEIDICKNTSKNYRKDKKGCPDNFSLHNDECYGFFVNKTQKLKYVEAKEECKRYLRYNLASVFSREETKYLGNMTVKANPNIGKKSFNFPWIGLHKNAYSPDGAWIWADGSQVSYTNWNANEPNSRKDTEHCAHIYPGGEWNDAKCNEPRGYICKGPLLSKEEIKIDAKGCRTVSGPSPNVPCIFPFEFKGIDHNQCIWDGDSENGAWCSTKVDLKGKHLSGHGSWGNCASECPFTPKPFKNTGIQTTTGRTTTTVSRISIYDESHISTTVATNSTTTTPEHYVPYTPGKQYAMKGKGIICSDSSTYTRSREHDECDGWPQTSLEECKSKCDANEVPDECVGSQGKDKSCKFVIWHANPDHPSGWCQLADDSCEIKHTEDKETQIWESSEQENCFEEEVDYYGNDISNDPPTSSSANECQQLCQQNQNCTVFTYVKGSGNCWLKTSDSGRTPTPGSDHISGKKKCKEICVPYSQETCRKAGQRLGLNIGGKGYKFAGVYNPKGCYAYKNGKYDGTIYYGTGGTTEQMKTSIEDPRYRPEGYDCSTKEVDAENPEDTRVPNDCFERDTDYYGNDINLESDHKNYGRGAGKRESVKDCQTLCQETKGCLVFTYKTGNKECWLKSTDNGRSNSAGDISGKKFCDSEVEEYVCGSRHCLWEHYKEDVDWGYYSRSNNDCKFCQEKCTNDSSCVGVECGGNVKYCSWWKHGRCVTKKEQTEIHHEHETCIKAGANKVHLEAYGCSYKGCAWATGKQGVDWDYYSTTNGNCTFCMHECDKDKGCEGVECGGSHCSWWKNGKCDDVHEHTLPSNGVDKMCVKKPDFRGCSENNKLSLLGTQSVMASNGWKFDLTHDGFYQTDTYKMAGVKCSSKWYGWSTHSVVGTLSAVLNGTGEVTIDFGNCWNDGNVNVYLDSKLVATASENTQSVNKSFSFTPGSLLEMKDEDGNAVIALNSIAFSCNANPQMTKDETTTASSGSEGSGLHDLDYYVYDYDEYLFTTPSPKGCVQVNHISDKPGYYTCDCLEPSDPCLLDGECVREDKCPSKDNQAIVSTNEEGNCFEDEVDYTGNDLSNDPSNSLSAIECQQICQQNQKCKAFTYVKGSHNCWLKTSDSGRTPIPGSDHVSGKNYCKECMDVALGDISSEESMMKNGWKVDVEYSSTADWSSEYPANCGNQTFYGYHGDHRVGSVSATFKGSGNATLIFGNCYKTGFVEVLLNNKRLEQANQEKYKTITFTYQRGDVIKISEVNTAIIKLHYFGISGCEDHENTCKTIGGPSDNLPCVFPFKFRGYIHNECNWDGDASDGAWCSTLIDDSGQHVGGKGNWGNCGPKCPIPPNSKEESPKKESLKKETEDSTCNGEGYSSAIRDDGSKICYFYTDFGHFNHSFDDTRKYCYDKNMTMVDIKGPKDDANVYKVIQKGGSRYVLISARKPSNSKSSSTSTTTICYTCPLPENDYGGFFWQDGSKVTYFNWYPGEPGDPEHQHCIQMFHDEGGKWRDATCHEKRNAILCQKPIPN